MSHSNTLARTARRIVAVPVLIAVLVGGLVGCSGDPASVVDSAQAGEASSGSAELDGTSMPPWPAPSDVPARVASAGLDLGPMGMAEHYHPQLQIIVNGKTYRYFTRHNLGILAGG